MLGRHSSVGVFSVAGLARVAGASLCLDGRARRLESRYPISPAAGCDAGSDAVSAARPSAALSGLQKVS